MTRGGSLYLKYNPAEQMVKASSDSGGLTYIARMAYDGEGKRAKRVDNFGTVHYAGPHYERNVGTGADTSDIATRLFLAQLGPLRRLIAVRRAGVLSYLHHDHLGSGCVSRFCAPWCSRVRWALIAWMGHAQ